MTKSAQMVDFDIGGNVVNTRTCTDIKCLFFNFSDVVACLEEAKYFIAPNATKKSFRIKPNVS